MYNLIVEILDYIYNALNVTIETDIEIALFYKVPAILLFVYFLYLIYKYLNKFLIERRKDNVLWYILYILDCIIPRNNYKPVSSHFYFNINNKCLCVLKNDFNANY